MLPSQRLREAVQAGWVTSVYAIPESSIQPASIDLRLGRKALRLRCSFLPAIGSPVEQRAEALTIEEVDIDRGGATLEPGRPYLIPLVEELRLPPHVRAKANPKSSTGRLDVFTRVLTDGNNRFDEVGAGYTASSTSRSSRARSPSRSRSSFRSTRSASRRHRRVSATRRSRRSMPSPRSSTWTPTRCRPATSRSPMGCSCRSTCPAPTTEWLDTARRRTRIVWTSRSSVTTSGATTGSPSIPSEAGGSFSTPSSSIYCSPRRASASRPGTPPR